MATLIDVSRALGDFLSLNSALQALINGRLYADTDYPPASYNPSQGGAICFKPREAGALWETEENTGLLVVNFQIAAFGADRSGAAAVSRALFAALDGQRGGVLRYAQADGIGAPLLSPDLKWPMVLTFYTCKFANNQN
jgi:hypothetical protein